MNIRRAVLLVVVVCVFSSVAVGQPWDGNGVEGDPYQIWDACDMQAIGANSVYWDAHFKLMEDIDLSAYTGTSFNIIGNNATKFTGVFDGNGHAVSNFTYDSNGVNYIGLFGYVEGATARITSLVLIDPNVDAGTGIAVGSLAGRFKNGTIFGCYAQGGVVSGAGSVGGLMGSSWYGATMQDCYSSSDVWSNGGAGGLAAINWDATILDCHASGSVSGAGTEPEDEVGGLVGRTYGNISGCYASGAVSGQDMVGGLVGRSDHHAEDGDISNCYASGSVFGVRFVGGLVGGNAGGTVTNCHSVGPVSGSTYVGGLVGAGSEEYVLYSFWDVNRSNQADSDGGVGKTTTQMQTATTFVEWLCEGYWTIDDGNDYPRLLWEDGPGLPLSGYLYAGGSGEPNDPFLIETDEQLNRIGLIECSWEKHFRLIADVDLSAYTGDSFNIIGRYVGPDDPNNKPFTGVFDGDGHTISNFTYSSDGNDLIAIFAYIDDVNAEIKNLGLIDPNIDAGTGWGIGALAGWTNDGTVRDCYVEGGSVSGGDAVGGLVGYHGAWGLITECYASSNVSGTSRVGGLVGGNNAVISNCYSSGEVSGDIDIGGLVGDTFYGAWTGPGAILNSYSKASVSGEEYVGGLAGCNAGYISKCYSVGSVSGNVNVGGLSGWGSGAVDSFWDTETSGQASSSGGTPKTTAEMQTESTFTDAGWDFVGEVINGPNDVWTICEGEDYPRLAWEKYGGGNGTEANPYLIRTSCQMNAIGADSNDRDKHFKLMADIDLSRYTGDEFNIIGDAYNPPSYNVFTGVFDGNGHTINHFSWESEVYSRAIGLFGYVRENAVIKDLRVENADVNVPNCNRVSALIGEMAGSPMIINCSSSGKVAGDFYVGGIAGDLYGQAIRCYSSCTVSGGGAGVITGHVSGTLSDSFAAGLVLGTEQAGGLAGRNYGTITNCYSFGVINSSGYLSGGLVGINGGTIFNSYSQADVQGTDDVGGLAGKNHPQGIIENCYSTGTVNGTTDVGGLLGYNNGGTLASCFWDSDVNPDVNGIGNTTDSNVIGETTANMQTRSTFVDAGWDFVGEGTNGPNDIWDICEGTNYPKFVWQIPAADFVCPDGVNFIDYAFFAEHWLQSIYGECSGVELTGDGKVNWVDFTLFAEYWKLTGCGECGGADFTGDENVDLADLYVFATYWLGFEYAEVDLTNDGQVDLDDLRQFTENWLAGM